MMKEIALIFPHQLFKESPLLALNIPVYIVEEYLFFNQYKFHKQKLVFHRASMKFYEEYIKKTHSSVTYIDATSKSSDIRTLLRALAQKNIRKLHIIDVTDNWLEKRIINTSKEENLAINWIDSPLFLNTKKDLRPFFRDDKKKFFQTSFYKAERQKRNLLLENGAPKGGKWTYDSENRKKYPKNKVPPNIKYPKKNDFVNEAISYVKNNYSRNYGDLPEQEFLYPTTFNETEDWLHQFLNIRFKEFGDYEDAIVKSESILNHSVLSPLLNIALITPSEVINASLLHADEHQIPINSTEGFIRQIVGWREFIRGVYQVKGTQERTTNFWKSKRKIPSSFYNATTGIEPIDTAIKKINKTAYAHHIERLMVLSNFMLLCEFDPDEVYQWFMELFIDAYDWVMVPNVYGMSLYADGGLMSTKPYISSSNYILKMSDYKRGEWCDIWDGLFWRFMNKNRDFFLKNPRLSMLIRTFDKMSTEKKTNHIEVAENYLKSLVK